MQLEIDPRNPMSVQVGAELGPLIDDLLGDEGPRLTVVVGGDGYLLRTCHRLHFAGPFLGLNTGHLGFLHNAIDSLEAVAERLRQGAWRAHTFPLLAAEVDLRDAGMHHGLALNDVYLERATGQAARLRVSVDGELLVDGMVADGLIIASALGSTAYSYSAGGSPAHPLLQLLKVTPICPHLPRLTPFDLPVTASVHVEVLLEERRPVRAVIDGRALEAVSSVTVSTSDATVDLAFFDGHDFTAHMMQKIVKP